MRLNSLDIYSPVGLAGIVHGEDVRMREPARDLDLAEEPLVS
jgi:hypothetical protein